MSLWIKIFLSLFLTSELFACDFASHVDRIYSLSGPVSVALRDMGFLKNPKLKGVSIFNPISKADFSGTFFPGGIFLSRNVTQEFVGGVLFFDESRELAKIFKGVSGIRSIEVTTRSLTPPEVTATVIRMLRPVLHGCDRELLDWEKKTTELSHKILVNLKFSRPVIFFLGDLKNDRLPEMIMANDGVVKWLVEKNKLKTYPSSLPYVNWSSRIMNALPSDHIKIALVDPAGEFTKKVEKKQSAEVLTYPGVLVPGVTQLEAISFWLDQRGQ